MLVAWSAQRGKCDDAAPHGDGICDRPRGGHTARLKAPESSQGAAACDTGTLDL